MLVACTCDPSHEQLLMGMGWVLVHCLLLSNPGQGDGIVVSMTCWVNKGGGVYLVGLLLDESPGAVPPSVVVLVSLPHCSHLLFSWPLHPWLCWGVGCTFLASSALLSL